MNSKLNLPVGVAVFAALVVGLMFLMPGGLLQAQSAEQFFTYPENGDGPVATFTASDPEGAMPVLWALTVAPVPDAVPDAVLQADIEDVGDFKIDQNGVLSFMISPNYEVPSGGSIDDSNEYRVTVQASDGQNVKYFKAYVNVTNVEETGKVIWAVDPAGDGSITVPGGVVLRQFQPGAELTASVTDPDAVTTSVANGAINAAAVTWKWYQSGTEISGETGAVYIVKDGDVGRSIRVSATYSDGSGPEESVSLTSETSVQAFRRSNDAPTFASTAVSRRIAENSTGNIGGPIVATDTDGDTLTYAISGGADDANFRIDPATGQLMVGPALMINYEGDTSYTVEVTAYDSSGDATADEATVTINVVDEDEKPTFGDVNTTASPPENITGAVVAENTTGTGLDFASYTATDPDGDSVSLSLMGDDASLFELAADTEAGNGAEQVLSFKKSPDFEMPGDQDEDNLYQVTVRASDGTLSADQMVAVKVTNVVEDGMVTIAPETALVGVELTATLMDPENSVAASGQITGERWTWHRDTSATFVAADGNEIANATSATYTPVSGDQYLRAMVSYVYQNEGDADIDRKTGVSDVVQVQTSRENQAPRFKDGASTFRVVSENVEALDDAASDRVGDNIGSPVEATDANADVPIYTLSGADASRFDVRSTGQLEVKAGTNLDHESNASHRVTVMVDDGSGESNATASIVVTIYVTDVDEAPKIRDSAAPSADGERTVSYTENGDSPVATFTANDPEGAAPIVWSLTDDLVVGEVNQDDIDEQALFAISRSGVLTFKMSPSYEPRERQ